MDFAVFRVFLGISRNFAEIPEFRGSATARKIRSPALFKINYDTKYKKYIYVCIYVKKKNRKNRKKQINKQKTTCSSIITLKKNTTNIYYLHCNKNFITLDLKM